MLKDSRIQDMWPKTFGQEGLFVSSFLKHLNIKNESLGLSLSWKCCKFPCRLNNDLHERENDLIAEYSICCRL